VAEPGRESEDTFEVSCPQRERRNDVRRRKEEGKVIEGRLAGENF